MSLEHVQKIMGSVNDLTQMCPLLKSHQRSGNAFMATFGGNRDALRVVPAKLRKDLETVAKVAEDTKFGMPIAEIISRPGLSALTFYTDAAGASFTFAGGKRIFHDNHGKGVASIGGSGMEDIWGWSRLSWPDNLLTGLKDEKGCFFGCKSTTLESVGVLILLITFPYIVRNKQLVFKIDNAAVMGGWQTGYVRNNETASEILKCIRYLSGYLGARIFVEHVDRMSDEMASLADKLSRRELSLSEKGKEALSLAEFREVKGSLLKWLEDPCKNGDLCKIILNKNCV